MMNYFIAFLLLHCFPTSYQVCQTTEHFECGDGKSIDVALICNGHNDCANLSDEENCRAEPFKNKFLIVGDLARGNLVQIGIDEGQMVPLLPSGTPYPTGIAVDIRRRYVYWTDAEHNTIGNYSLINGSRTVVYAEPKAAIELEGLAFDPTTDRLYFTKIANVSGIVGSIETVLTDGSDHRVLYKKDGMKPRAIVLDVNNRMMYWTDCGENPSINKANMDTGLQKETIISSGLVWPNALAIDFEEKTMFWADANTSVIAKCPLNSNGSTTVYTNPGGRYYALLLTPQYIYVTDRTKRAVRRIDRKHGWVTDQPPPIFGNLTAIAYVDFGSTGELRTVFTTTTTTTHHHNMTIVITIAVSGIISTIVVIVASIIVATRRKSLVAPNSPPALSASYRNPNYEGLVDGSGGSGHPEVYSVISDCHSISHQRRCLAGDYIEPVDPLADTNLANLPPPPPVPSKCIM